MPVQRVYPTPYNRDFLYKHAFNVWKERIRIERIRPSTRRIKRNARIAMTQPETTREI